MRLTHAFTLALPVRRLSQALGFTALVSLGACGGGGGGDSAAPTSTPTASAVDAFVGNWLGDCQVDADGGYRIRYVITKLSSSSVNLTYSTDTYPSADCSTGTPTTSGTGEEVDTYTGSKTVSGKQAGKFIAKDKDTSVPESKYIALVENNTFYIGTSSPVDSDGYPEALNNFFELRKQ